MLRKDLLTVSAASAALIAGGLASPVRAQEQQSPSEEEMLAQLEEIVVTATASRLPESLDSFPGSVTQLDLQEIDSLRKINSDLSTLLGQSVPGLAAGSAGTASNFDQSLRGRKLAVLIDGVPIGTPLRDGRHDIRVLSANVLENIEVIRGATAIYGNGGEGGSLNYITRSVGESEPAFRTELGFSVATEHTSDSLTGYIDQSGYGRFENSVDYVFSLYREQTGGQFDADGDRIRPSPNSQGGMADSDITNLFFKLGRSWGEHRLELTYLDYDHEQDTDYFGVIAGDAASGIKTQTFKSPRPDGAVNEANENALINLTYKKQALFTGTDIQLQYYEQELDNIFSYNPTFFPGGGQSQIVGDKSGLRIDLATDLQMLRDGFTLLWGVDLLEDITEQSLVDGRVWAPKTKMESQSLFAQITYPITDSLLLRGGFRNDQVDISYPGFTALFSGDQVRPGKTDYDETLYNLGVNYSFNEVHSTFVAYSEGFTVAEVARLLRQADDSTDFATAGLEAPVTENWEIGYRANWGDYTFSIAYYESQSDLGTNITSDLMLARSEEEIEGVELSFDGAPGERTRFGMTYTAVEGERDADGDGSLDRDLASNRVAPDKFTAYLEYDFSAQMSGRLQALHSADRDKFDQALGFAEHPIEAFTLVDASLSFDWGKRGALSVAVQNLFNEDYFTLASQFFFDNGGSVRYSKGMGRILRVTYSIDY